MSSRQLRTPLTLTCFPRTVSSRSSSSSKVSALFTPFTSSIFLSPFRSSIPEQKKSRDTSVSRDGNYQDKIRGTTRIEPYLLSCPQQGIRFLSLHVTYAPRTALLRFRRSAPKCSLDLLRCPALSVGDASFLSVSEDQSLVHCLW